MQNKYTLVSSERAPSGTVVSLESAALSARLTVSRGEVLVEIAPKVGASARTPHAVAELARLVAQAWDTCGDLSDEGDYPLDPSVDVSDLSRGRVKFTEPGAWFILIPFFGATSDAEDALARVLV